jgi:methylated-DNA-protein-cysteine methyltransferase-like protein
MNQRDRILAAVRKIPSGRVASYGDVARMAGIPRGARQVGWALASLAGSVDDEAPWWRVVNREGRFSLPPHGAVEQARRLNAEGIEVWESGVIAFARWRWDEDPGWVSAEGRASKRPVTSSQVEPNESP